MPLDVVRMIKRIREVGTLVVALLTSSMIEAARNVAVVDEHLGFTGVIASGNCPGDASVEEGSVGRIAQIKIGGPQREEGWEWCCTGSRCRKPG